MNQGEALVTVIEFVRSQGADEPRVVRALKVLEKRALLLQRKLERMRAQVPADLQDEPLTVTWEQFREIFRGEDCVACYGVKPTGNAFCARCFGKLDGATAKAFKSARTIHWGFCRALRLFGRVPAVAEAGGLYWLGPLAPLDPQQEGGARG